MCELWPLLWGLLLYHFFRCMKTGLAPRTKAWSKNLFFLGLLNVWEIFAFILWLLAKLSKGEILSRMLIKQHKIPFSRLHFLFVIKLCHWNYSHCHAILKSSVYWQRNQTPEISQKMFYIFRWCLKKQQAVTSHVTEQLDNLRSLKICLTLLKWSKETQIPYTLPLRN